VLYLLSLHDALPICLVARGVEDSLQLPTHRRIEHVPTLGTVQRDPPDRPFLLVNDRFKVHRANLHQMIPSWRSCSSPDFGTSPRSEEHTSELQSPDQ